FYASPRPSSSVSRRRRQRAEDSGGSALVACWGACGATTERLERNRWRQRRGGRAMAATEKSARGGAATVKAERPARAPEPPAHSEPPVSWFPLIAKEQMEPEVR